MLPEPIQQFITLVSKLPSIGPRQATRLSFWLVKKGRSFLEELARAIANLRSVQLCSRCFFVHINETSTLCPICSNDQREQDRIMVVEKETDLMTIERSGAYRGIYFVLGELTRSGVLEDEQKRRIETLITYTSSLSENVASEIIIALNPTTYGDLTAGLIERTLRSHAKTITRIGRGIPTGGEIEFADEDTIGHAINRRV